MFNRFTCLALLSLTAWFSGTPLVHATPNSLPMMTEPTQCGTVSGKPQPFLLILKKEAPLVTYLLDCLNRTHLRAAWISAHGTLDHITLGADKHHAKPLPPQHSGAPYTLLNLTGQLSWQQDQPTLTQYALLADDQFHTLGGPLLAATTATTASVLITPLSGQRKRKHPPTA
jgi:predicted DNA-binding protein with PD1-like motif